MTDKVKAAAVGVPVRAAPKTIYYVDESGKFLGGFSGEGALGKLPEGAKEVPSAPEHGRQVWNGSQWGAKPAPAPAPLTAEELFDMLKAKALVADEDRPRPKE